METKSPASPPAAPETPRLRIYFLPNLLTAGNMFCGFLALTKIVEANPDATNFNDVIRTSLFLILLACIFDLFDGRVARMGGRESPFGREFDSLADVISFGVAPAFLVHRILLKGLFENYPQIGWFIASIYVICGAFRLARFNCLAAMAGTGGGKEFLGFPIPAAAGLVTSITYFILWLKERGFSESPVRFILPAIMLFLSLMMVSEVKYPTFKSLDFRAKRTFPKMVGIVVVIGFVVILWEKILPVALPLCFTTYLIYGFVRPRISRKMRHEIEEEEDDEEQSTD
ncbi:MAG TPA: CDP-diacylglycerol--serine O-phosphatidyltransferase [Verrucomicrobiae bacterium]